MQSTSKLIADTINLGFVTPPAEAYSKGSATDPSGVAAATNIELILSTIVGFITILAAIWFVVNFFIAALEWASAGESGKVQKVRDKILNGTVGLVIIVAAYGIVGLLGSILGLKLLQPQEMLFDMLGTV